MVTVLSFDASSLGNVSYAGATPLRWRVKCFRQVRPIEAVVKWWSPAQSLGGVRGSGLAPRLGARDRVSGWTPARPGGGQGRHGSGGFTAIRPHQATRRSKFIHRRFVVEGRVTAMRRLYQASM